MRGILKAIFALLLCAPEVALAQNIAISVDVSAAEAVLKAVQNPQLTTDQAMKIAQMPGNQGLIRKAKSYGRSATDATFAKALVAAAHGDAAYTDTSRFDFDFVRDHAAETEKAMAELLDPSKNLIEGVKARIAKFTPTTLKGAVTGYLVVGGTSGGFAFGSPEFYLNLDRFPSARLAATIMGHELYHAVQALAQSAAKVGAASQKCLTGIPHSTEIADFFGSLSAEGTASYVGDVLSIPADNADGPTTKERARFARNVAMTGRSITQLELSIHGLATGAEVSADDVYELGFYGDEVMYGLGYIMARAIAAEQGDAAIGELIGLPGSSFVDRYVRLRAYGKSEKVPPLKPASARWATKLTACAGRN